MIEDVTTRGGERGVQPLAGRIGRRIALLLVRTLGGKTLGLGYAIMFTDLVLAPFTPSNTARA